MKEISAKKLLKFLTITVVLLFIFNVLTLTAIDVHHGKMSRTADDQLFSAMTFHFDEELGWDFQGSDGPDSFNDIGLRDDLSKAELEKKRDLVVILGSSVILAPEVEFSETFTRIMLARKPSPYYLNAGFEGFEIYREIQKYERDLSTLRPRKIIWFPFANDLETKAAAVEKVRQTIEIHRELTNHTRLLTWQNVIQFAAFEKLSVYAANFRDILNDGMKDSAFTQGLLTKIPADSFNDLTDSLSKFHDRLKKRGIELQVVFTPSREYAKHHTWAQAIAYQQLASFLESRGIRWCEMFSKFGTEHFLTPTHWNKLGHRVVADHLEDCLK